MHIARARARERMRQFDYAKKTRLLSLTFEASKDIVRAVVFQFF